MSTGVIGRSECSVAIYRRSWVLNKRDFLDTVLCDRIAMLVKKERNEQLDMVGTRLEDCWKVGYCR